MSSLKSPKPLLIFDGDCNFCRIWIARWKRITGDQLEYASYQEAAGHFPAIPLENFKQAVHLIEPSGYVSRGAEAVFRSLSGNRRYSWLLWIYLKFPGFRLLTEKIYRFIAEHRFLVSRLTRWI